MQTIGLTGGMASGKTTVASMLRKLGVPIVDADATYHRLIAPESGRPSRLAAAIAQRFQGCMDETGTIDRQALGELVFERPAELKALGAITHPAVAEAVRDQFSQLAEDGHGFAIYDVPLLYERDLASSLEGVIVVWVPTSVQIQRLIERDNLDVRTAQQRLKSQMSLDEKRRRADWVVDNSGTKKETERQVVSIWNEITGSSV